MTIFFLSQEHLHSEEELIRMIQLLEDLDDLDYWIDGCCRLMLHSVRFKRLRFIDKKLIFFQVQSIYLANLLMLIFLFHPSFVIPLLKQLKDKIDNDESALEFFLAEVCSYFFLVK